MRKDGSAIWKQGASDSGGERDTVPRSPEEATNERKDEEANEEGKERRASYTSSSALELRHDGIVDSRQNKLTELDQ